MCWVGLVNIRPCKAKRTGSLIDGPSPKFEDANMELILCAIENCSKAEYYRNWPGDLDALFAELERRACAG